MFGTCDVCSSLGERFKNNANSIIMVVQYHVNIIFGNNDLCACVYTHSHTHKIELHCVIHMNFINAFRFSYISILDTCVSCPLTLTKFDGDIC
jgi:hypothetical protein